MYLGVPEVSGEVVGLLAELDGDDFMHLDFLVGGLNLWTSGLQQVTVVMKNMRDETNRIGCELHLVFAATVDEKLLGMDSLLLRVSRNPNP